MTILLAGSGHRVIHNQKLMDDKLLATWNEVQPSAWIQGMADGFDLQSALLAIREGIPVISAMPWLTHYTTTKFPKTYTFVLDHSEEVFPVSEEEEYVGPWLYFARNEWMIDEADRIVAWWDGRKSGGTYGAIKYAKETGKPVRNIYA